jgi:hypothetical protein
MSVFGPFYMAHSFVMASEICSMRAHEGREPALVACTPPFVAENELFVFAVEKDPPRKCSRFSGADRFGPCRLHADIYEPIVNYLGIAGGIVKRRSAFGRARFADRLRVSEGRFVARAISSPTFVLKVGVSNGAISLQYIHSRIDLSVLITFSEKRLFSVPF